MLKTRPRNKYRSKGHMPKEKFSLDKGCGLKKEKKDMILIYEDG